MKKPTQNPAPFAFPLPYIESPEANADIGDAFDFMDAQEGRQGRVTGEWAERWHAAYLTAVDGLRARFAGDVRMRPARHELEGEDLPSFRENFATPSGSPWVIWYRLEEDATGAAVRLIVRRVKHGRAKGNL